MKYKCLVFDHDDTVVNSTATIHYPCFQEYLNLRYPGRKCSLEEYFIKNFEPGFVDMCRYEYGMSDEDMQDESQYWRSYVKNHIPKAYSGLREIMERQKAEGGYVCVVSHSYEDNIRRDYRANSLPEPDAVFGWERPENERKPSPFPLREIMRIFSLKPAELLVVDDLKPGFDMAAECGVDFAGAGWSNDIEYIQNFLKQFSTHYFKTVEEFDSFLR